MYKSFYSSMNLDEMRELSYLYFSTFSFVRGDIGKRMQFCYYNMEGERETMGVVRDCVGGYTDR
jgi:hypothetical protein